MDKREEGDVHHAGRDSPVKKILVVGSNGLLGQKMTEILIRGSSAAVHLASIEERSVMELYSAEYHLLDITVKKDVRRLVGEIEPDVIVNCAAMTNVDACESERETAWKINVGGVENLIDAARGAERRIVHVSTDYIFDGKQGPYTEEDRPEPISYYGKTKLASENALRASGLPFTIARTMVLYGLATGVKANFALWLIESLQKGISVKIVDDQFGNPTLADDLAFGLLRAVELGRTGVYNIAGRDIVSRYEFSIRLAKVFGLDPGLIKPIKTSQLQQPAPRPLKSGLLTLKAEVELGYRPSTIEEGLAVLKSQLSQHSRRMGDSSPVAGGRSAVRHSKQGN
jgi:dTDP-4-dehydrorhamnose reductase